MRPEPRCVIDRSRPCGGCIAAGPQECPYAYLLDADELASIARAGARQRPGRSAEFEDGGVGHAAALAHRL